MKKINIKNFVTQIFDKFAIKTTNNIYILWVIRYFNKSIRLEGDPVMKTDSLCLLMIWLIAEKGVSDSIKKALNMDRWSAN